MLPVLKMAAEGVTIDPDPCGRADNRSQRSSVLRLGGYLC